MKVFRKAKLHGGGKTKLSPTGSIPQITIAFGRSAAENYKAAVEAAQKHPTYQESGMESNLRHSVTLHLNAYNSIKELIDIVGGWEDTRISINGETLPSRVALELTSCYSKRCERKNPKKYCFIDETGLHNHIGCRLIRINPYDFGFLKKFCTEKDGSFLLDKDRFLYEISKNLQDYRCCPALDLKLIEKNMKRFPKKFTMKQLLRLEQAAAKWADAGTKPPSPEPVLTKAMAKKFLAKIHETIEANLPEMEKGDLIILGCTVAIAIIILSEIILLFLLNLFNN